MHGDVGDIRRPSLICTVNAEVLQEVREHGMAWMPAGGHGLVVQGF
jgi:hypothetical protein